MEETILIVDDECEIADLVEVYLKNEGYAVFKFYNSADALKCVEREKISLAILDVMLPDMDGFTLCQKIRKNHLFPIIMLTAKVEDIDKITGLTLGADDYITKPFSPREVVFRIKAQLRRQQYQSSIHTPETETVATGRLLLDKESCRILKSGKELSLTGREFLLLAYLIENADKILSKERLYEHVWGEYSSICDNTIMVHIRHIREKIEDIPSSPRQLVTIKGLGYKLKKRVD